MKLHNEHFAAKRELVFLHKILLLKKEVNNTSSLFKRKNLLDTNIKSSCSYTDMIDGYP